MSIKRGDKGNRQDGNRLAGDDRTNREIVRGKRRRAGDRSATVARQLMQLKEAHLKKLVLDVQLRDEINTARKITALVARRRAERTLAGDLRRWDIDDLIAKLAVVHESNNTDTRRLHDAEDWRTKLIEGGSDVAKDLPGGVDDELVRMIAAAKREKESGKPPGAARALFRNIMQRLDAEAHTKELAEADEDDDEHTDPSELDDDDE